MVLTLSPCLDISTTLSPFQPLTIYGIRLATFVLDYRKRQKIFISCPAYEIWTFCVLMGSSEKRSTAITADTTIVKGVFTTFWRYEIKKPIMFTKPIKFSIITSNSIRYEITYITYAYPQCYKQDTRDHFLYP